MRSQLLCALFVACAHPAPQHAVAVRSVIESEPPVERVERVERIALTPTMASPHPETLSTTAAAVIQQRHGLFDRCFALARRGDPSLASAKLEVRIHVDRGVVTSARTSGGTAALGSCTERQLRGLRVAARGSADSEFPLVFAAY